MNATLPADHEKSAEDLLADFEWRFAGLYQIAQTTLNLNHHLLPAERRQLGMSEKTARYVDSLWGEYKELEDSIRRMEDDAWKRSQKRERIVQ